MLKTNSWPFFPCLIILFWLQGLAKYMKMQVHPSPQKADFYEPEQFYNHLCVFRFSLLANS